jgi:formate dehydrogenase iron-sulfur subunit
MRESAHDRIAGLKSKGFDDVQLYDPIDSSVGGIHALFIVRGDVKAYNLPVAPEIPTVHLQKGWKSAGLAAGLMFAGSLLAFFGSRQR